MGYMMSSPIVRFIMTLFNVRLGFWLGNPGEAGSKQGELPTYRCNSPRESVKPILFEALGLTDEKHPYVYLSDGGHFENFGLYEMVRRRCRFIVVSDATTDPSYQLQDLARAIRLIRVDFNIPIEMEKMSFGNQPRPEHHYCAIGTIRYSSLNPAHKDGILIYLKPSLRGDEPCDVQSYHREQNDFPEESIADQWFSEKQFEAYRALGAHIIDKICNPLDDKLNDISLSQFEKKARTHAGSPAKPAEAPQETGFFLW
jgi:hypothetical protein